MKVYDRDDGSGSEARSQKYFEGALSSKGDGNLGKPPMDGPASMCTLAAHFKFPGQVPACDGGRNFCRPISAPHWPFWHQLNGPRRTLSAAFTRDCHQANRATSRKRANMNPPPRLHGPPRIPTRLLPGDCQASHQGGQDSPFAGHLL